MTALRRPGIGPPETELEAFLRRNAVTPLEAYKLAAGAPCPHCGTQRRSASAAAETDRLVDAGYSYEMARLAASPVIYR